MLVGPSCSQDPLAVFSTTLGRPRDPQGQRFTLALSGIGNQRHQYIWIPVHLHNHGNIEAYGQNMTKHDGKSGNIGKPWETHCNRTSVFPQISWIFGPWGVRWPVAAGSAVADWDELPTDPRGQGRPSGHGMGKPRSEWSFVGNTIKN